LAEGLATLAGRLPSKEIRNVSDPTATLVPATQSWRIKVLGRADLVFSLRDYLRRLGLSAEVESPTLIELKADEPAGEIEEYVSAWSRINGTPLHVERARARDESQPLLPSPAGPAQPRLGELLVSKGYITEAQLSGALFESRATNDLLGVVLLREKLIFEEELARTLSQQLSIPYISIMRVGINSSVTRLLPPAVGAAAAAIPVRPIGEKVQVAFADPTDPRARAAVARYLPRIDVAVAELSDIRLAWRGLTGSLKPLP
jgi:hypothetical protein